jgi:murein DD-endopeptidase MepM/ murein hydrolase activator NlpD
MTPHTVKSGDTLARIAATYRTTVAAILQANPALKNANRIAIGQTLQIPTGAVWNMRDASAAIRGQKPVVPAPLGGLRDQLGRIISTTAPTSNVPANAALRGDVISFILTVGRAYQVAGYTKYYTGQFTDKLNANGLSVIAVDDSGIGLLVGGTLKGQVRINRDGFSDLSHAVGLIRGIAKNVGYSVTAEYGEFVSKLRDGGGGGSNGGNNTPPPDPNKKSFWDYIDGTTAALGALLVVGIFIVKD